MPRARDFDKQNRINYADRARKRVGYQRVRPHDIVVRRTTFFEEFDREEAMEERRKKRT